MTKPETAAGGAGPRAQGGGMGGRLRQLAGQSFVYGLGGIVSKLVGIFLLPIYTRPQYVSQAGFGQVETVMAASTLAAIVCRLGLTTAMFRFCWDHREPEARRRTIRTAFTAVLALSTVFVLAGAAAVAPLSSALQVSHELALIGLAGLWVSMNYDIVTGIYRIEQRPTAFVVYSLFNIAITIALSVVLVIPLRLGAAGIMLGNFSGTYITYFLLLWTRRDMVGLHVDRPLIRQMLAFSLPLMPAGVALWALNLADRVQVQRLTPGTQLERSAQLGTYSAASKIALGIMLVISAFQTAWVPFANLILDDGDARRTYRAVLTYWSMTMAWGVVVITMLSTPYIHIAMNPRWFGAVPVVPLLMIGSVLYGAYYILNIGVNRSKRTRFTPVVTGTAAAVNIGLNFWMIPRWGILGAAWSTVIGYAVLVVLGWRNAQHSYPVDYDFARVLRVVAVAVVFVVAAVEVVPATGWIGITVRIALSAVFPLGLLAVGALTPGERRRIKALADQVRKPRRGRRAEQAEELEAEQESAQASPL
jgi:O-antigen/teichoic acid export membrane protein